METIIIYEKVSNTFPFLYELFSAAFAEVSCTKVDISPGCGYNSTKTKVKREGSGSDEAGKPEEAVEESKRKRKKNEIHIQTIGRMLDTD